MSFSTRKYFSIFFLRKFFLRQYQFSSNRPHGGHYPYIIELYQAHGKRDTIFELIVSPQRGRQYCRSANLLLSLQRRGGVVLTILFFGKSSLAHQYEYNLKNCR